MVAGARKTRARARKEKRARARKMKQSCASLRGSAWHGAPARAQEAHSVAAPRRSPPLPPFPAAGRWRGVAPCARAPALPLAAPPTLIEGAKTGPRRDWPMIERPTL